MNDWPNINKASCLKDGEPCGHPGCLSHVSHPCEGCGRVAGKSVNCIGLVFRGYSSTFFNYKQGRVERREGFRLLKNKSCKGCSGGPGRRVCDNEWLLEDLDETMDCTDGEGIIFPEEIINGALYRVKVVNVSRDWESGIIDNYDLEFYRLEEK